MRNPQTQNYTLRELCKGPVQLTVYTVQCTFILSPNFLIPNSLPDIANLWLFDETKIKVWKPFGLLVYHLRFHKYMHLEIVANAQALFNRF